MQIHSRRAENQVRWIWRDGLRMLGQREIAVQVSWSEQDLRDTLLTQLLEFLEYYITRQQTYILPGQTLSYGWTILRFVSYEQHISEVESDVLLIQEKHLLFSQNDQYVPGVSCTMALLQLQHEAMQRNRVTGEAMYPSPSQSEKCVHIVLGIEDGGKGVKMNNTAKMNIFGMFHDGDFVSLVKNNQDVGFQIEIRYLAELIQPEYTLFSGILKNCRICQFKRWEDTETIFEDIEVINALINGMEILHARLDGERIIVNCQGMKNENKGGDFLFDCDDIELFDQGGRFVTEDELQVLSQKAVADILEEQMRKIQ